MPIAHVVLFLKNTKSYLKKIPSKTLKQRLLMLHQIKIPPISLMRAQKSHGQLDRIVYIGETTQHYSHECLKRKW